MGTVTKELGGSGGHTLGRIDAFARRYRCRVAFTAALCVISVPTVFAGPAAAKELAMSLAQGPSIALGYIKQNINTAERATIEAVLDTEAMNHVRCTQTEDHHEAAKAFVEKRKAAFKGR